MTTIKRKLQRHQLHRFLFFLLSTLNLLPAAVLIDAQVISTAASSSFVCSGDTHKCLNGGSCVEGIAKKTGQLIEVCHCQDAIDQEGDRYVGLYCELKASKEDQFCINGGIPRTIQSGVVVCSCPEEYTGLYCELSKNLDQIKDLTSNDKDDGECTLECMNGGVCAFGRRVPTPAELALYTNFDPNSSNDDRFFYEYCQCPDSFNGTQCESSYDVCTHGTNNNKENYCHNNATCVYTKDLMGTEDRNTAPGFPEVMCECSAAHTPGNHYTGKYCEFRNLVTCNDYTQDILDRQFCTNGGTCTKNVATGAWSCACPEGYDGIHCENDPFKNAVPKENVVPKDNVAPKENIVPKENTQKAAKNQNNDDIGAGAAVKSALQRLQHTSSSKSSMIFFWSVLGVVVGILLITIFATSRNKKGQKRKNSMDRTPSLAFLDMQSPPPATLNRAASAPQDLPLSQCNGRMSFNSRRFKTPNTESPIVANVGRSRSSIRMINVTYEEDESLEDMI